MLRGLLYMCGYLHWRDQRGILRCSLAESALGALGCPGVSWGVLGCPGPSWGSPDVSWGVQDALERARISYVAFERIPERV